MKAVFVDTGAFYAAINQKDDNHRETRVLFNRAVQTMAFDAHFEQYGKLGLLRA